MSTDVQEEIKPAVEPGAEPSPAIETTSAEKPDQKEEKPQVKADSGEEEEPKPDKDNRAPFEWVKRLKTKNEKLSTEIEAFKKFGIESPEHAESLQRDANSFNEILTQLRESPEAFEKDLQSLFPDAHQAIVQTALAREFASDPAGFEQTLFKLDASSHERMMSNAVRRVLIRAAESHAKDDPDTSKVLEDLAKNFRSETPRSRREEPKQARPDAAQDEKWEFFEDQVATDVGSRLTAKINEEITSRSIQFRNDAQKDKFVGSIFDSLDKALNADQVFVRERDKVQDPRAGLTKAQRKNAADLYLKFSTVNGRLGKLIAEEIDARNLPIGTVNKPIERKEINSAGIPPTGKLSADEKDKIWDKGRAAGKSGSDLTAYYYAEVRKMRSGT